jgi:hypothetical protein
MPGDSGYLVWIIRILGLDNPDNVPGVSLHVPGLSEFQGFQPACFSPAVSRLILIAQSYV